MKLNTEYILAQAVMMGVAEGVEAANQLSQQEPETFGKDSFNITVSVITRQVMSNLTQVIQMEDQELAANASSAKEIEEFNQAEGK